MSKIYILKTYPNDLRSPEPVEVDIDELERDYQMLCRDHCSTPWTLAYCKDCEINHKSFSKYLQERIEK